MDSRTILHCDINHCFAQIEEMKRPELRNVPMCVGGSEEKRSGIVLARNLEAKKYGVKTAETLREAYQKCPNLVVVSPSYQDYIYYSEMIKNVYREYSSQVESFGIDEAWVDVTHSQLLFGSGYEIAKDIQERIHEEFGITISIGVSFNKIFAKLGSDLKKPKGLFVITRNNYKSLIWPLNVETLMYVGPRTVEKLHLLGIYSIGDLATFDLNKLKKKLGKQGEAIWCFANGLDDVAVTTAVPRPKSVGNGITTPRNLDNMDEVRQVLYVLVESVAARLKSQHLEGYVINLSLRNTKLHTVSRQVKREFPTHLVSEIMESALMLLETKFDFMPPYRSLTVTVSQLVNETLGSQVSLFQQNIDKSKDYILEKTVDDLRSRYGAGVVLRTSMLVNRDITDFNPKEDHVIHPVGYFK